MTRVGRSESHRLAVERISIEGMDIHAFAKICGHETDPTEHPGGVSRWPYRDYHLGFQSDSDATRFPLHTHLLSQVLTLQGAVAHSDMPIESGPTRCLPFSQRYLREHLAWRDEHFVDFFEQNSFQLSLEEGDAAFFNPGLHHAAGANATDDIERITNLLQISSAMGPRMEAVDTYASADGYSFPSSLDLDPLEDGTAPQTAQQLMHAALTEGWSVGVFSDELGSHRAKRMA